jgi:hypothetical protein
MIGAFHAQTGCPAQGNRLRDCQPGSLGDLRQPLADRQVVEFGYCRFLRYFIHTYFLFRMSLQSIQSSLPYRGIPESVIKFIFKALAKTIRLFF